MAEDPAPAVRQRKKRKWDQPAEALVSPAISMPLPSIMQFGGANPLTAFGMPNMMTMMSGYMSLPMVTTTIPVASPLTSTSSAAAIVQKINQELVAKGLMLPSKVHDEVISREIVINDADPGVRYKLTKRQTQEEIQAKTGAVVITRGRFRPPNGPPDLEKPLYLHISAGVQLKDTAERIKAVDAATAFVEEMMKQGPPSAGALQSGGGSPLLSAVVNVGIEADPSFNLIGRIRGPNDQYIKHIMTETGAEVVIRGRGSGYTDPSTGEELQQPLHLFISSESAKSLDDARKLTENLLETIRTDHSSFRPGPHQPMAKDPSSMYNHGGAPHVPSSMVPYDYQHAPARNLMDPYANMRPPSKSYSAVPPPQRLMIGGASDASTNSSGTIRIGSDTRSGGQEVHESPTTSTTSAVHVSGVVTSGPYQPPVNASHASQNTSSYYQAAGAVPYPNPSYPGHVPTSTYGGYGGVYPQVSPLQQVAAALQRPPLPVSVRPGLVVGGVVPPGTEVPPPSTHSGQSTRQIETNSSGPVQKERRKFQEFPVAAKDVATDVSQVHQSIGSAKENAIGSSNINASVKMPPPPPKFIPPPPKFTLSSASVGNMPPKRASPSSEKGASEPEQDGLKLVEYGEEDDDDASEENVVVKIKAENSQSFLHPNGKPFWAAP
ncbi:hypothetical protein M758_4G078800 [Ceratodon purpureus]|nr:hypothetical protein M758_4G078800 [Ceratodon purpureus]